MGFYKDCGGLVLYIICDLVFILQFCFIYKIKDEIDNKQNIFLTIHKIINYILLFLSVYSHVKTSIIDPGTISCKNNNEVVEFYNIVHEPFIKRALLITERKTPEVVKKIILGNRDKKKKNQEESQEEEEEEDNPSDKDDYKFEKVTSINDKMKKDFEDKYHLKLSRCINCFVIRPINAHHCSVCHKCFIDQDHHCPWVNNCIGLFNKKVFILFLFYSSIEVIYSDFLFFYYSLYKNINQFKNDPFLIILDVFSLIFGLILAIVSIMLLFDQYDSIVSDCTQCDFKKGILLEKFHVKDQFEIIFGGNFTYKWLLPFYPGGNNEFFKKMNIFLKIKESVNKNNIEENIGLKDKVKNE